MDLDVDIEWAALDVGDDEPDHYTSDGDLVVEGDLLVSGDLTVGHVKYFLRLSCTGNREHNR